jgi:hypothetical protein
VVFKCMVCLVYGSQGGSSAIFNAWCVCFVSGKVAARTRFNARCVCFMSRKVAARRGGDVPRRYWE